VRYALEVNGRTREVIVERDGAQFVVQLDDREWRIDAAQVGVHTLSLLLADPPAAADGGVVSSRELSVATNPVTGGLVVGVGAVPVQVAQQTRRSWGQRGAGADGASGPQKIVAPMPGKVVRVLGKPGDAVTERQAVVVIEAMKMENELRAARDGSITEVLVQEGQSVEAGTLLAVITPA
jgi:biotin carboxyl carrier protein